MKAIVLYEHGGQDQLIYETDYRDPKIGPGDVLVRVKASSLNYHDVFTRRGMPGIKLGLPVIIPVAEFRDLVGAGITATLAGADPATELKKAHEQFRPILERSEKT